MNPIRIHRSPRERGYILITMAGVSFALMGAMGLAIDMGRLFIAKNETQAYCDAAALDAAEQLDGTSTGITNAIAAAKSLANKWNLDTGTISNPTVDFAQTQTGTYSANPGNPSGYIYARVTVTVTPGLYFVPAVMKKSAVYKQNVISRAIAGQIDFGTTPFNNGAMPYTAVSTQPTATDFGFVQGGLYDMQWPQYNGTRNKCNNGLGTISDCFNSPPCTNDSLQSMSQVVHSWGASTNGYWGYSSNSLIAGTVLGTNQVAPVYVGENLDAAPYTTPNCNSIPCNLMTNGNKAAEASILDDRASEDSSVVLVTTTGKTNGNGSTPVWNLVDGLTTRTDYLNNSPLGNGRRTFLVPVVYPGCSGYDYTTHTCTGGTTSTTSTAVIGWGEFLLYANGSPGNSHWYQTNLTGNDPYCAVYMGPWDGPQGSAGGGSGSGSGAYRVKLVQ